MPFNLKLWTTGVEKQITKRTSAVNCAAVYYMFVNIERKLLC